MPDDELIAKRAKKLKKIRVLSMTPSLDRDLLEEGVVNLRDLKFQHLRRQTSPVHAIPGKGKADQRSAANLPLQRGKGPNSLMATAHMTF